jgi:hypothetical protein
MKFDNGKNKNFLAEKYGAWEYSKLLLRKSRLRRSHIFAIYTQQFFEGFAVKT